MPRTRPWLWMAIAALAAGGAPALGATVTLPAYFSPSMPPFHGGGGCPALPSPDPSIPRHWFQQTQPPVEGDNCQSFVWSPLTDASDQLVSQFSSSSWTGGLWPRVWAYRARRPQSLHVSDPPSNPVYPYINTPTCQAPNGPPRADMILGLDYSTVDKANAATTAEVLRMLGAPASAWQGPLIANGFNLATDLINYSALDANPGRYVNYRAGCDSWDHRSYALKDKFIVHDDPRWVYVSGQSTPPTGVMIDFEVHDFRTPAQGALFLAGLAGQIRARSIGGRHPQAFLYTNPWEYVIFRGKPIGGMAANGFDYLHIDAVKSAFDFISLYLGDKSGCNVDADYATEFGNLKGVSGVVDLRKLVMIFDLTRCTPADALALFNLNAAKQFGGYAIFPKDQHMGGQRTPLIDGNLLLWKLLYGSRTPPN